VRLGTLEPPRLKTGLDGHERSDRPGWPGCGARRERWRDCAAAAAAGESAIVQDTCAAAGVWRAAQIALPKSAGTEVPVKVRAAGSSGTWHLLAGQPYLMRLVGFGVRAPRIVSLSPAPPARSWRPGQR
jgi:hypothetical protein